MGTSLGSITFIHLMLACKHKEGEDFIYWNIFSSSIWITKISIKSQNRDNVECWCKISWIFLCKTHIGPRKEGRWCGNSARVTCLYSNTEVPTRENLQMGGRRHTALEAKLRFGRTRFYHRQITLTLCPFKRYVIHYPQRTPLLSPDVCCQWHAAWVCAAP